MKYILVILSILSAVVAQLLIKNASLNVFYERKWVLFMLMSVTSYGVAFLLQSYLFKFFPLSKIAPIMAISIMMLVFVCSIWLYGETVNFKQVIGVLLGIVSIYLILA